MSPSTSQNLVSGIEQFGRLLGMTLTNNSTSAVKTRHNIGTYVNQYIAICCDYFVILISLQLLRVIFYQMRAYNQEHHTCFLPKMIVQITPAPLLGEIYMSCYQILY